ncbi:lipase lipl-1-like [Dermacentor silvarum]|uniref:lipase lipl-1-like n=1 Tax=Dermacentor silvarum TaxID=543639 RepID=UPI001899A8A5|nr:lipase lipl-1-like [Dermacentor silvarum]
MGDGDYSDNTRMFEPECFVSVHRVGLMKKNGYPVEMYKVTTDDGYILEVDRMPRGRSDGGTSGSSRPPVLMVHGIVSSAADWVINKPDLSAGFLMADRGYDVWLINTRGVPYSNYHVTLSTNDPRFWDWSFEDIGYYDVAATVDFVLNNTGRSNLSILAWSQGFTEVLVLLSLRPEYNNKVSVVAGYAPVANITHIKTPVTVLAPAAELIKAGIDVFTMGALLTSSMLTQTFIGVFCNTPLRGACFLPIQVVVGASSEQLNRTRIPVYIAHQPAGTSTKNIVHYAKNYRARNFKRYDYGLLENQKRYGQVTPPQFPLEKVRSRIGLFRGPSDRLADPTDIDDLVKQIGKVVALNYDVPQQTFQHLDFVLGSYATEILHEPMIQFVSNYSGP